MKWGKVGTSYRHGDVIFEQGSTGDDMYVVQEGAVDIIVEEDGKKIQVDRRREGELLGELAIFGKRVRGASAIADGSVRVLTLDKKALLRRLQEDPLIGYRIAEVLAKRVRELSEEIARLKASPTNQ